MTVEAFAPAKINLTLHVTGRRADGYHLLDSLVVFADVGDRISASPAEAQSLQVEGPMAAGVPADGSNLMLRAARLIAGGQARGAALHLDKHLPMAAGIGGGSADAAAALKALSELWQQPMPAAGDVLQLGADLPVCLAAPVPQRMRGTGERLDALPPLPDCGILLVNPGVAVATPAVFKALTQRGNPPMPDALPRWQSAEELAEWLGQQRNDLQAPAEALAPQISGVLAALRRTQCLHAGMSGSGATCFALYVSRAGAQAALSQVRRARPGWWAAAGTLL
ncbi:4-(cytidine 5'-diphospho)-2-C-methyl-D-erythritol kinase [Cribrihabitans neustonicus]|uniref:4-(cytidine 5'-diphospho)-2-C-methyl-D-erythritol kinase n=1 Tax=Cribrihabitans neustonicus TaxID=1429085 RepID=UPI003B59E6BF